MSKLFAIGLVLLLAGCGAHSRVASIKGACDAFPDPRLVTGESFAPRGKTRTDDRWVTGQQAVGIKVCGWPKPKVSAPADAAPIKPVAYTVPRARVQLAQHAPKPKPVPEQPTVPTALVTEVKVFPTHYTIEPVVEASKPIIIASQTGIAWPFWWRLLKIVGAFTLLGLSIGIAVEIYARWHARKLADNSEELEASTSE